MKPTIHKHQHPYNRVRVHKLRNTWATNGNGHQTQTFQTWQQAQKHADHIARTIPITIPRNPGFIEPGFTIQPTGMGYNNHTTIYYNNRPQIAINNNRLTQLATHLIGYAIENHHDQK